MKLILSLEKIDNWGTGGNGTLKITNADTSAIEGWSFTLDASNFTIGQFWNFNFSDDNVSPKDWNKKIQPGASVESGFSYTGSSSALVLSSPTVGVSAESQEDIIDLENPSIDVEHDIVISPLILGSKKKIFGYFSEWSIYQREFSVSQIPHEKLTHIVYAFMLPNPSQADLDILKSNYPFPPLPYNAPPAIPEATLVAHDEYANSQNILLLKELKKTNKDVKVLISIGGWSLSWTFSKIAKDPVLRKVFIDSSIKFVIDNGFDGIDIDWEFVGKQGAGYNVVDEENDGANFIILLKEMREALDVQSPDKYLEITAATGCNPIVIANYEGTEPYLDYILLMSYDFAGGWDNYGGHLSALYHNPQSKLDDQFNCHASVKNTLAIGYPSEKICLGCPMYGRGWEKITPTDNSIKIFGDASAAADTISGDYGEPGMSSWRDIRDAIKSGDYVAHEDTVAKAAYCVDSNGKTWSYDSPATAVDKAKYVKEFNLGGMLFWELSDDTRDNNDNILDAVVDELIIATEIVDLEEIEVPEEISTSDEDMINDIISEIENEQPEEEVEEDVEEIVEDQELQNLTVEITNNGSKNITIRPGETIRLQYHL